MSAVAEAVQAPRGASLDLHEGIVEPRVSDPLATGGCKRWPEALRLLSSQGELVRGRCRATNLCEYCQTLYTVETVEMLTLDAMEYAPSLWAVLTSREHLTRAECRGHLEAVRRSARKRWPDIEWFVQVEFQRRGALHLNLLIKGVPVAELDELRALVIKRWCKRVDAEPVGQWFGAVEDGIGVVKYLSKMLAHGLKAEQRPPIGWKGHRTSQTRGYFVRPAAVMRQEAKTSLARKRALHRQIKRGLDAHDAELVVHQELELAAVTSWRLIDTPTDRQGGHPCTPTRRANGAEQKTPCPSWMVPTSSPDPGSASNASKASARGSRAAHGSDTGTAGAGERPELGEPHSAPVDRKARLAGQNAGGGGGRAPQAPADPPSVCPPEVAPRPPAALPHYRDWLL